MLSEALTTAFDAVAKARGSGTVESWAEAVKSCEHLLGLVRFGRTIETTPENVHVLEQVAERAQALDIEAWIVYGEACEELLELHRMTQRGTP